jgi:hypothetical protein
VEGERSQAHARAEAAEAVARGAERTAAAERDRAEGALERAREAEHARAAAEARAEQASGRLDELVAQLRDVDARPQAAERELAVAGAELDGERRAAQSSSGASPTRSGASREPSARAMPRSRPVEEAARGGRRPRRDGGES